MFSPLKIYWKETKKPKSTLNLIEKIGDQKKSLLIL